MRRRTRWALAGALAGSTVLTAGSTFAVFTDVASVSAAAGAGSLTLTVGPDATAGLVLVAGSPTTVPLTVRSTGQATAEVWLSLVGEPSACAVPEDAVLLVTGPAGSTPVSRSLGNLDHRLAIADLDPATPTAGDLQLQLGEVAGPVGTWTCALRLELVEDGGFSDVADLPLTVTVPPPGGTAASSVVPPSSAEQREAPAVPDPTSVPTGTTDSPEKTPDGGSERPETGQPPVDEGDPAADQTTGPGTESAVGPAVEPVDAP
jgi:hypothetical protein